MIRVMKASELEAEWFSGRHFEGADETVRQVVAAVAADGDAALELYGKKFDVSAPASLRISEGDLRAAAEKLKAERPEVYDAVCYSHELAYKFALRQKESFTDFEMEIAPGMAAGQKTIPVARAGVY
nr:histidinol dehydrogenase [Treponemataceae bacterium]